MEDALVSDESEDREKSAEPGSPLFLTFVAGAIQSTNLENTCNIRMSSTTSSPALPGERRNSVNLFDARDSSNSSPPYSLERAGQLLISINVVAVGAAHLDAKVR